MIAWILTAGRFPFAPQVSQGGVLVLETSEELPPARNVGRIVRSLGERGIFGAVEAVILARPPVSDLSQLPPAQNRARRRAQQRDAVVEVMGRYNPEAVICFGIPFRPYQATKDSPARRHHNRRWHRASGVRRLRLKVSCTRTAPRRPWRLVGTLAIGNLSHCLITGAGEGLSRLGDAAFGCPHV